MNLQPSERKWGGISFLPLRRMSQAIDWQNLPAAQTSALKTEPVLSRIRHDSWPSERWFEPPTSRLGRCQGERIMADQKPPTARCSMSFRLDSPLMRFSLAVGIGHIVLQCPKLDSRILCTRPLRFCTELLSRVKETMARLLLVEDETALRRSMTKGLEEEGHEVLTAVSGDEAVLISSREPLDCIILDLLLPDGDGITALKQMRAAGLTRPVLIVTARDSIEDRITGLDSGADDYLIKPFAFAELLARLRALLRRNFAPGETVLRYDNLELDLLARCVRRGGEEIVLTRRQFELLEYLMQHLNQIVSRDLIARDVWKASTATWTNVIDVQVNQLRKRLERDPWKTILHTVRGSGYKLGDPP